MEDSNRADAKPQSRRDQRASPTKAGRLARWRVERKCVSDWHLQLARSSRHRWPWRVVMASCKCRARKELTSTRQVAKPPGVLLVVGGVEVGEMDGEFAGGALGGARRDARRGGLGQTFLHRHGTDRE